MAFVKFSCAPDKPPGLVVFKAPAPSSYPNPNAAMIATTKASTSMLKRPRYPRTERIGRHGGA
jgi:hypothetical protein